MSALLIVAFLAFACALGAGAILIGPATKERTYVRSLGHGLMAAAVAMALVCLAITTAQCPSCAI